MASEADRSHVRLAELVSALSLGIDLGFGQPMEHVLRQCLIALRLAEGLGLDEEQRAVVYYTALLINVGCHSDAHSRRSGSATTSPRSRSSTTTTRGASR
jgi:response regulator RpfG family c-di-GMP phosphodiesterase